MGISLHRAEEVNPITLLPYFWRNTHGNLALLVGGVSDLRQYISEYGNVHNYRRENFRFLHFHNVKYDPAVTYFFLS
jgi:hypothetical protein